MLNLNICKLSAQVHSEAPTYTKRGPRVPLPGGEGASRHRRAALTRMLVRETTLSAVRRHC